MSFTITNKRRPNSNMGKSSGPDIILRPYKEGDENGIARLIFNNFPDTMDVESIRKTWFWQFRNKFSRYAPVMVASSKGEIVAQYAVMWMRLNYKGETIGGAISTATVTDKEFRGKGLFTNLAKALYEQIRLDGNQLVYGFPNSQSTRGFIDRLNWFKVCHFPVLVRPMKSYPFIQKAIKTDYLCRPIGFWADLFYRTLLEILNPYKAKNKTQIANLGGRTREDMNSIWKCTHLERKIAIIRDAEYLEWRYLRKPFFKYNMDVALSAGSTIGYLITYFGEMQGIKTLYIMEMIALRDNRDIYKRLIERAVELAKKQQADAISILVLRNSPNYSLLLRNGFIPVPRRMFPQRIYFGARANGELIDDKYVRDWKNWYISWGDLDVV